MRDIINEFLKQKDVAIAGVSRDKEKWGNMLLKELRQRAYKVYPVNPYADELEGEKAYPDLKSLPAEVETLIIAVKPDETLKLVQQCPEAGIKRVWMQKGALRGSFSQEAYDFCKQNNINCIYGLCPMMFYAKGMHSAHFWLKKVFGRLPREFV